MGDSKSEIDEILSIAWTGHYKEYLRLYEKGLKKQAKILMKEFIKELKDINETNRRYFVDTVYRTAFKTKRYSILIPENLYREIFVPVIERWVNEETENPIALRWSNELEHIQRAVQIDSTDQIALEKYCNWVIGKISMNQHEISSGFPYDGNPIEDISMISRLEKFIGNIQNSERRQVISETLQDLKDCAMIFLKSKK